MKWKDDTSYSRSDTDRTPRVWAVEGDPLRLKVHRRHGIVGIWFASCDLFERRELIAKEAEAAQAEAVALVVARLQKALSTYDAHE